jgi:hypothetical protein
MSIRTLTTTFFALACAIGLGVGAPLANAADDDVATELLAIQHAWDKANYETTDVAAKKSSFEALTARAERFVRNHPDRAEPLVWQGIVLSTYAGVKGGLGALSLAKESRDSLLAAVKLNGDVLNGSAYTSLGALYYKVPRWPVGFGDHDKAAEYLRKALALNPDSIDQLLLRRLMFRGRRLRPGAVTCGAVARPCGLSAPSPIPARRGDQCPHCACTGKAGLAGMAPPRGCAVHAASPSVQRRVSRGTHGGEKLGVRHPRLATARQHAAAGVEQHEHARVIEVAIVERAILNSQHGCEVIRRPVN